MLNTIRLLLLIVGSALAQLKVPEHFFAAPDGPFACHAIEATPADSAASLLEFIDGEVNARETLAAFDTAGVPLYMTVQMTESTPSMAVSHNVLVRFKMLGEYLRIETPFRNGKPIDELGRITATESLNADEMTESYRLAVWLWDHRCNR
jgi:hypothetical protein